MICKGGEGLRVRPTFLGSRAAHSEPGAQAGAIEGITLGNMRLGPLARATLAGAVEELYRLYQAHATEVLGLENLVATGGAVRKNPLLPQLIADRFGLPVQVPRQTETAALGAAVFISGAKPPGEYRSLVLPTGVGDEPQAEDELAGRPAYRFGLPVLGPPRPRGRHTAFLTLGSPWALDRVQRDQSRSRTIKLPATAMSDPVSPAFRFSQPPSGRAR